MIIIELKIVCYEEQSKTCTKFWISLKKCSLISTLVNDSHRYLKDDVYFSDREWHSEGCNWTTCK